MDAGAENSADVERDNGDSSVAQGGAKSEERVKSRQLPPVRFLVTTVCFCGLDAVVAYMRLLRDKGFKL